MYIVPGHDKSRTEKRFTQHALNNRMAQYDQDSRRIVVTNTRQMLNEYANKLICPKCEQLMFRKWPKGSPNRKQGMCPHCGYYGPSVTVEEYLSGGYHFK